MFSFFYPETGDRFFKPGEHEYDTEEEAACYWKENRKGWEDITKHEPAFIYQYTGDIIVIREM